MRTINNAGGWSPHHFIEKDDFDNYLKVTSGNATAAAICYFTDRLCNELHDFDHQLKLGLKDVAEAIGGLTP